MSESVLDFASLETIGSEAVVEAPVVDANTGVETPAVDGTEGNVGETKVGETNADGTPKTELGADGKPVEKKVTTEADDKEFGEKTPQEVRKALKAFRDANASNAGMTKQLHGAYERWEAAKQIFPGGVKEMQSAKEFTDLIGGVEGYEALTGVRDAAQASDAKLYEGNPELIKDIVEDLQAQGKLNALGKLAPAFLDAVKTHDEAAYKTLIEPHALAVMVGANMPTVLQAFAKVFTNADLNSTDPAVKATAQAKALQICKDISDDMGGWFKNLEEKNKAAKAAEVSPERQKLEDDRKAFLRQQEEFKTNQSTEFKNSVAKVCESHNNKLLGAELAPFLKMSFFKGYGKENLMPLGNTLKQNLYAALKSDNAYQIQMKAMWGSKTPDRAKIEEYHQARVASIARGIVQDTVSKMYPGYTKGGAAAGRVAAAADKKAAVAKVENAAAATGKPIYVPQKPGRDSIDWDHIDAKGKPDAEMLMITGKAYLKPTVKGQPGKFVTWRKV
jgi:hypothetical protein